MPSIEFQRQIKTSVESVWAVLTEFADWPGFFDELDRVIVSEQGDSSLRLDCSDTKGHVWQEAVTTFEPNRQLSLELQEDGQHWLHESRRTWTLQQDGEYTSVQYQQTYETRIPVIGALMEQFGFGTSEQERAESALEKILGSARAQQWTYKETVQTILNRKGNEIYSARPTQTVSEMAQMMQENGIGTILIVDSQKQLLGLVSERDIVYQSALQGSSVLKQRAEEIMTTNLIVCEPESDLLFVMACMSDNKIRHLPVISSGELVGIVSIGDVVKQRIHALEAESETMRDYIAARQWQRQSDVHLPDETVSGNPD